MDTIDVSVVIVNWNTEELLDNCISSIKEKTHGIRYEIIIVDNASQDGSVNLVKSKFPDCKLIESDRNLGFTKANNLAITRAFGKYILFLNPDTKLITNTLFNSVRFLETHKEFGALGCKLIFPDHSIQYVCARTFPTPFNQFCELAMLNRLFPKSRLFSSIELEYWDHTTSSEIDCISGAYIMVRKNIIDKLQGFDENIFMYADDVDLCYRIKQEGWKLYYLADEEIIHYAGVSSKQKSNNYFSILMQKESNYYFINKHFGKFKARQFKLAVGIGTMIRLLTILPLISASKVFRVRGKINVDTVNKYFNLLLWSIGLRKISDPQ